MYEEYYEEGDLGYYEDGTKRTLTDEQIAIFRHSEVWKAYSKYTTSYRIFKGKFANCVIEEKLKADAAAQANLAAQLPEIDTAEPHVPLKRKHVQEDNSDLPYDDGDVGNWTERRLQDDGQPPKKGKVGGNSAPNQVYRDGFAWPVLGANNDN